MTKIGAHNPVLRVERAVAAAFHDSPPELGHPSHPSWVIGHRGAARYAAENSIESFQRAVDLGANGVETDICVTRDGHFVLWHDADPGGEIALARQAGREELLFTPKVPALGSPWRRRVSELSLEEFRAHYGYCHRRGGLADLIAHKGPPEVAVATLDELLEWASREARVEHLFLDVKLEGRDVDAAVTLLDSLREPASAGRLNFHYANPHREVLEALAPPVRRRPLPPRLRLFADFELPGALEVSSELGLTNVSLGAGQRFWNELREELVEVVRARDAGDLETVIVWTINEEQRLRELVDLGVDGILTDDSSLLRSIVAQSARRERAEPAAARKITR